MSRYRKNKLVAPFLKWVGGKRQLIPEIVQVLPSAINKMNYVEPFIGGGAILFHLQPQKAIINDFNTELINVYKVIKNDVEALINDLAQHKNDEDYYYHIRALDRNDSFTNISDVQRASRIIYLNKTCYNGLYRVNNSGEFNTPFGRYKNPNIVNEPTLRAVSTYLNSNNISLNSGDYSLVLEDLPKNSFVYFDPPYHPLTESANFTGYIQGGWDESDQIRLREACDKLTNKGIKFLLSNSCTNFIKEQYQDYNITVVQATRAVNSNAAGRGNVDEVLITNYGKSKK
nr:DNA adenine methylase [Moraxella osloensis]